MKHEIHEPKMMKSVTITEADNGFIVNHYGDKGEKKMIAKDMPAAMSVMEEMMGAKAKAMPAPAVMRVGKRMR